MTSAPPQAGPVTFLVGSERSGTTLLRLMLDSHPELAFRYEFEIAVEAMPDDTRFPEIEDYYQYLRTCRFVDEPPAIDRSLDYPALVRSFLEQKRVADGKPHVGAVVHKHFDRLLRIWPDARFIHLMRDGRDVAQSCVRMGWYGNAWAATERWVTAERLWERMIELVPEDRRLDVHYEELVTSPVEVLVQICNFIGIEYHPAMLEYPEHSSYKHPVPNLAFQWPRKLAQRDIQLVEARIGDLLLARGYRLSGLPRIDPTALDQAALRLGDRLGIMYARMQSLGPRLWLEYLIASRIGPRAWRESALSRIHGVMNTQLD